MPPGTPFTLEVNPKIPAKLARLEELANDLWYSWDRPTRTLFSRLHPGLWDTVGHNPKAFLKRINEQRLQKAAEDQVFLSNFNRILSAFDTYHSEQSRASAPGGLGEGDLVAYFCFEFGFHESLPIYSGGLGILAGDHCKAASDLLVPFVGVGMLYREGYFFQTIDKDGNQQSSYVDADFDDLPVRPVRRDDGSEVHCRVDLPGRDVEVKVWQAQVGHVTLYLLDTDLEGNKPEDRDIAHRLYGGDRRMRIEQEIILGVGGVRALREIGLIPTVWHMNEGHAAFLVLERIRELVRGGLDFATALEVVAASTVFTTHTAVPAGHDHFAEHMIWQYFERFCREVGIAREQLLALGHAPDSADFNMTALAVRGSRFHNGVSRIHGGLSSHILRSAWPQVEPEENPVDYVTNGVHVPTFLASEWMEIYDRYLGHEWRNRIRDADFWTRIDDIPDHVFWSVRQSLKSLMLQLLHQRLSDQHFRNHGSEAHLDRMLRFADSTNPNVLTIGFARRFATYKRAALLFANLNWLREIMLADPERPVLFIFAGKAHPADVPGHEIIRSISRITRMPEFEGRVLLVEGYDLRMGRRLVSGVDVWLNNPIYPLEASGTSGMKAGINGVINLSVLDGWWGEGYDGKNGWAIKPAPEGTDPERRDREESQTLYEILQDQVVPLYYGRGKMGYSPEWVRMAKRSMATILPLYNSSRMTGEYVTQFYTPASRQYAQFSANGYDSARRLSRWKARIRQAWQGVALRRLDVPYKRIRYGESLNFEVAVKLNGMTPEDVVVEMLIGLESRVDRIGANKRHRFRFTGTVDGGEHHFVLKLTPEMCGKLLYRVRIYPHHSLLTHPLEMGMMVWL
ncbi:MAG TPA: alpha-glucan family phosphorylase [Burkholderiales bacterium]|nr:alpha-glucan family phosphorylase [Burkholderiales bacterium]